MYAPVDVAAQRGHAERWSLEHKNPLQGSLEIKDTRRPQEGPTLLDIKLPYRVTSCTRKRTLRKRNGFDPSVFLF